LLGFAIDQPSTRTSEGSGAALRKEGNCNAVLGDKGPPYNTGDNRIDSGKGTTNPAMGKKTGLQEMPQRFVSGSGNPPSRLND
jgi:hypothetical protein